MRRGRGSSVARRGQYSQRRATCGSRSLPAIDRPLQLLLVHLGAAVDAHPLGLVVELLLRAALRSVRARALAAAAARRHVLPRRSRRGAGLARAGTLLVHGASRDFFRSLGRGAAFLGAVLDLLVLPFALVAPCVLVHADLLFRRPTPSAKALTLVERRVLHVVLGGVLVREVVHDVGAFTVGVIDLHEGLPFVGQRVLGEDRLDRTLGLAGTAIDALLWIDDEDPLELVDAVDGADVHAGEVFDVDAGLGDDVRHAWRLTTRSAPRQAQARAPSALTSQRPGRSPPRAPGAGPRCPYGSKSRGSGRRDTRPPPRLDRFARRRRSPGPAGRSNRS